MKHVKLTLKHGFMIGSAIGFIMLVVLLIVGWYMFFLSFSGFNIYPKHELCKYLKDTYGNQFTYESQKYFVSSNDAYHIWKMKFKDENGKTFYEYFYMNKTDAWFATATEYGRIWDTYEQIKLEEQFKKAIDLDNYANKVNADEKYPENHFVFDLDDEKNVENVSSMLAQMFYKVIETTDNPKGITLQCAVEKAGHIVCLFDPESIETLLPEKIQKNITEYEIKNVIMQEIESAIAEGYSQDY